VTADRSKRRRPGAAPSGTIIGDHATVIVSGNGVVGGSGNSTTGPSNPVAPDRVSARGGAGKVVIGVATVVGTVIAAMAFVMSLKDSPSAEGAAPSNPSRPAVPPQSSGQLPSSNPADGIRKIFDDVVILPDPVNASGGVDIDGGEVRKQLRMDADTDMSASSHIFTASVRNSALYSDTGSGDESGAYQRCHDYRSEGVKTQSLALASEGAQFCFTTSEGRPGWFQVVTSNDVDRSLMLKVVAWQK
jgi:hypothetical protein